MSNPFTAGRATGEGAGAQLVPYLRRTLHQLLKHTASRALTAAANLMMRQSPARWCAMLTLATPVAFGGSAPYSVSCQLAQIPPTGVITSVVASNKTDSNFQLTIYSSTSSALPLPTGKSIALALECVEIPLTILMGSGRRKRSCSNERRRKLILIEGIFEALPDRREDFVKLALQTMAASQLEKGCSLYRFTADLEEPTHFTFNRALGDRRKPESSPYW